MEPLSIKGEELKKAGIRILLIEDNPGDARLIEEMLKEAGDEFELEWADCLSSGISRIKIDGFDVILLDLGLPDSQGLATLMALSEIKPEAPVIVLTGLADEATGTQAVHNGAQDYLIKGQVDKNLLMRSIKYAIERKRAEEELREANQFNLQIIESAKEGIIVYGPDLKYQVWNPFMEKLTGFSANEVLGKHPLEVFPFLRTTEIMAGIEKALQGEISEAKRIQFNVSKTGLSVWVSDISGPLRNSQEEIIGVIGMVRDITEHHKLEEQLRQSQKMEAIGTLAGGVAHDFNNILSVIMGYGTMVMDCLEDGSTSKKDIKEVLTAAERAATLTKRLLVFSRKQVVEVKPVNINETILSLQKMLNRIISENIDFKLDLADKPLVVMADAGQIEQVLMNLTVNAKDVMPDGGHLTISTRLEEIDDTYIAAFGYGRPGKYALITVTDTGSGMDEETRQKIFEPFFTTKGIGEGTGLGLSIAYGIVKQHHGYINVDSEPGHGAIFKIYLPVPSSESKILKEDLLNPKSENPKPGNETILVAEDDAPLRKLSRIALESHGYTVILAEDGEDAIKKFAENREKIKLVMLDMIMPKKSGKEAYDEIRKTSPEVKVLFVSGYTMDIIKTCEITEDGLDFMLKPVRPMVLLRKVREILDRYDGE